MFSDISIVYYGLQIHIYMDEDSEVICIYWGIATERVLFENKKW